MSLERKVEFSAAWDKRNPDPRKNYGVHGVEMRFLLLGPEGAIQFVVYTNWMLDCVLSGSKEWDYSVRSDDAWRAPVPADFGYHSFIPLYEGHGVINEHCPFLGGKPCYYDGSGLAANRMFYVLVNEGSDGVWREMEREYAARFSVTERAE